MASRSGAVLRRSALGAALLLVMAACGGGAPEGGGQMGGAPSGRCGDRSRLGDTLNFYNWADQMGLYYDPDNTYSIPYQYSTTGIAYNATAFDTPPDSWAVLFNENTHCWRSSLLEHPRETIGAALAYLGYDWNSADPAAHEQALQLLLEARKCLAGFDSANYIGNLAGGDVLVAQSWGFAAGIARQEG